MNAKFVLWPVFFAVSLALHAGALVVLSGAPAAKVGPTLSEIIIENSELPLAVSAESVADDIVAAKPAVGPATDSGTAAAASPAESTIRSADADAARAATQASESIRSEIGQAAATSQSAPTPTAEVIEGRSAPIDPPVAAADANASALAPPSSDAPAGAASQAPRTEGLAAVGSEARGSVAALPVAGRQSDVGGAEAGAIAQVERSRGEDSKTSAPDALVAAAPETITQEPDAQPQIAPAPSNGDMPASASQSLALADRAETTAGPLKPALESARQSAASGSARADENLAPQAVGPAQVEQPAAQAEALPQQVATGGSDSESADRIAEAPAVSAGGYSAASPAAGGSVSTGAAEPSLAPSSAEPSDASQTVAAASAVPADSGGPSPIRPDEGLATAAPIVPLESIQNNLRRFVAGYDGGRCFLAAPVSLDGLRPRIDGYGLDMSAIEAFSTSLRDAIGIEADVGARTVTDAQCTAIDFLKRNLKDRTPDVEIKVGRERINNGERLTGEILGVRHSYLSLVAIDDDGLAHDMSRFLRRTETFTDFATDQIQLTTGEGKLRNQILVAIDCNRELEALRHFKSMPSSDLFRAIQDQARAAAAELSIGIAVFHVN